MNSVRDVKIISKCKRVVEGCKTYDHRQMARRYLVLASKALSDNSGRYELLDLTYHKRLQRDHV